MKKTLFVEVTVVRILVVVFQMFFLKTYTKYVSVYELGIYYFLQTVSYSLNAFLFVPLDNFQQSELYALKNNGFSLKSFYGINKAVLQLAALLLVASEIICYFIDPKFCYYALLVILLATGLYLVTLIRGFINNLEKRRVAIYSILLENILKIAVFLGLVIYFKASAVLLISGTVVAYVFVILALLFFIVKMPEFKKQQTKKFNTKEVVQVAYPIAVGSVINWIQIQGYRLIMVPLGLAETVGLFGTLSGVGANAMLSYSSIFSQLFVPLIYKTNGKYITTYIRNGFISLVCILIGGYFFSGFIVGILTKREFVPYSSIILYGILSEGGSMLLGPLIIFLTIQKKTKILTKSYMIALAVFIVSFACVYFFKALSLYTVGIPIVLTQIVIVVYLYLVVKKI